MFFALKKMSEYATGAQTDKQLYWHGLKARQMQAITERLRKVRSHFGFSQRAMATFLNISAATWHGYEQRGDLPNSTCLENLATENININWLLTGDGEMLRSKAIPTDEELVYIPRYDELVAAGSGAIPLDHQVATPVAFSRQWLLQELRVTPAGLFLIEARGNSMSGLIEDGDVLLIDTNEPKLSSDGIYVFSVDGLLIVKQLRSHIDSKIDILNGDGEIQQSFSRKNIDNIQIIGRVIWKAGRA